jgi:carboxylesterase type B
LSCEEAKKNLMPVIAYIGGTRLIFGVSDSVNEGPEYLLDHDVVLVTINYRLGALGFLSTGTEDASGNLGFKDQVLALRWIRDNIEKFGGNSSMVTLMGWSAGGMSAMLHMVSPMSQGLFHQAIIMSGSVPPQIDIPTNQLSLARKQAKLLKCPRKDPKKMVECLKNKKVKEIVDTTTDFYEYDVNPWYIWYPVIEPDFGQERFLTGDPYTLIKSGNYSKVPTVIGRLSDDFFFLTPYIFENKDRREDWNITANFHGHAEVCFMYDRTNSTKTFEFAKEIYKVYIRQYVAYLDVHYFVWMFDEAIAAYGIHRFVELTYKNSETYYYYNKHVGSNYKYFNFWADNDPSERRACKY